MSAVRKVKERKTKKEKTRKKELEADPYISMKDVPPSKNRMKMEEGNFFMSEIFCTACRDSILISAQSNYESSKCYDCTCVYTCLKCGREYCSLRCMDQEFKGKVDFEKNYCYVITEGVDDETLESSFYDGEELEDFDIWEPGNTFETLEDLFPKKGIKQRKSYLGCYLCKEIKNDRDKKKRRRVIEEEEKEEEEKEEEEDDDDK
jgi:hypothetical protein